MQNKEEKNAYQRKWNLENKEKKAKYGKTYRNKNREEKLEHRKDYYEENKEENREYYMNNKERIIENAGKRYIRNRENILSFENKEKGREKRIEIKEKVFNHYGHRCQWLNENCNIIDSDMLQVDHTNGGGNEHRRETGLVGPRLYSWLIKNNFPEGFRLLCVNHNWKHKANMEKTEWENRKIKKEINND